MNAKLTKNLTAYAKNTPRLLACLQSLNMDPALLKPKTEDHAKMLLLAAHWRENDQCVADAVHENYENSRGECD